MAEGFSNETPEDPGYELFAEDLVNFVMLQKSPPYTAQRKLKPISTLIYDKTIYEKFSNILCNINFSYTKQLLRDVAMTPSGYKKIVLTLEEKLLDKDFTDNSFLNYCLHISAIAALFYNEGEIFAPEIAKSHIVHVLKNRMPADRWTNIRGVIEKFPLPNVQSSESTDSNV